MSLTITVNGGGTFTASMEEGPVSFTASLAAVGPQGPAGANGAPGQGVPVGGTTGQVLAKASGTDYDTAWVAANPFNQSLNTTDTVSFDEVRIPSPDNHAKLDEYMWRPFSLAHGDLGIEYRGDKVLFANETEQFTALPNGTADGYIVIWNAANSTYVSSPNETRALFMLGTNKTGTTIAKGKAVYVSGATGNHPEITLAQANSELSSASTIGITSEEIANNGTGKVIVSGRLENVNTNAFAAGDTLYLSPTTAGDFTTTFPTQPNHGVLLGYVTRANANTGVIEVVVKNYQELEEQSDVLLTSKQNNDLLSYESSSGLWKNKSFSTLGLLTSATAASTYAAIASTNTFTASQVIETTNTTAALRVTQLGTGEAFRVEDSANPDASPFVITADGSCGVGTASPSGKLSVNGNFTVAGVSTFSGAASFTNAITGTTPIFNFVSTSTTHTGDCLRVENRGSGSSLRVDDAASDTTPFIVDAGGNVGVKTASPSTDFEVNGNAKFTTGNITTAPAAGDSSSLIPTTAWVQAEVPAASTTAAGKVELATDAEAIAGTSTTLAVTPRGVTNSEISPGTWRLYGPDFTAATSGTGGLNDSFGSGAARRTNGPTSTGAGHVVANHGVQPYSGQAANGNLNWTRRVSFSARIIRAAASPSSESIFRVTLGEAEATNTGDPTVPSIGIKVTGSGAMVLLAHDGTTLSTSTTTHTPSISSAFDLLVVSDGAGNVEAFVNGSSVGTTTGAPTTLVSGTDNRRFYKVRVENTSSFTSAPQNYFTYQSSVAVI